MKETEKIPVRNIISIIFHLIAGANFIYGLYKYAQVFPTLEYVTHQTWLELVIIKYILTAIFFELIAIGIKK